MIKMTTEEKTKLIEKYRGKSLADLYPDLAKEWHPTKNGDLTPEMVATCSNQKVWWFLPYDDAKTGKHFNFEWKTHIQSRSKGGKCPYLSGRAVWPGFNDLATIDPDLAKEWHPTKNGDLTPEIVASSSNQKVWWFLKYYDVKTNKHFDFEWEAEIVNRHRGIGCPFLAGRSVWPGFNDLATTNPNLAKEFHPTKNGNLTPSMISAGSSKKVWWYLPYDDIKTGKHFVFEWEATPDARSRLGCPFLNGNGVWTGFNDLATTHPNLAVQWHPTKNGNLTPETISAKSSKKIWWICHNEDDASIVEWEARVNHRVLQSRIPQKSKTCAFLRRGRTWGRLNVATRCPDIAAQWHPTKNGNLTPENVSSYSSRKVWWVLPYDDINTGKHFDFEWEASVENRCRGTGCPFLSGQAVWRGFNDLATVSPQLASEWHPTKNGELVPCDVTYGSEKKVWWQCINGHEWFTSIRDRRRGSNCPYCKAVSRGESRISDFCKRHDVTFYTEHKFDDCVYKDKLRFDHAVFHKNGSLAFLVEYDGEQHFKPVDFSGKNNGKEKFALTQVRDSIKNEYCRKNRIPLVRISYKDYDNIEKILLKKMVRYGLM